MTLTEYYNKVKEEIRNKNIEIIDISNKVDIPTNISLHIESLNYMIYEWNEDHNDPRIYIFDYIIRPKNCDYDFTSINFKDFFNFLMLSKDKNNEMVDIFDLNEEKIDINKEKENEELDEFWLR